MDGLATAGLPTFDGDVVDESQHELACNFCFYFIQNNDDEDGHTFCKSYKDLVRCGRVQTVETFWAYYSHLLKPSDLPFAYDVCFFKEGFQPLSGDQANVGGGKWTARLRKSVSSRVWEDLLLAMVGGAWDVHLLLQGAMMSVRADDDMLAVWCDHNDRGKTLLLRQVLLKVLNLPKNSFLEYKRHGTYRPPQPGLRYTIESMQALRDKCKETQAPIYLWESLDCFHELRAGGVRDKREGGDREKVTEAGEGVAEGRSEGGSQVRTVGDGKR